MAKAVKCPVCGGAGKVANPPHSPHLGTAISGGEKACHGCGGKGWVEVSD